MRTDAVKKGLLLFLILSLAAGGGGTFFYIKLRASLPVLGGEAHVPGLGSPVTVTLDQFGIPTITAQSRLDAFRALGYVAARDRLFQMDLMRRATSGRLAEIIGRLGLENDIKHRVIGFNRAAVQITRSLPKDQREALEAYAEGVNAFLQQMETPPLEFLVLGYRPEPWRMEDSILVFLNMFEDLYGRDDDERMMTIMKKRLPPEVVDFLTPDASIYATPLFGGSESFRPIHPIPVSALASLRRAIREKEGANVPLFKSAQEVPGSNNWAINRSKTPDGRAVLANDMHLGLSVPNIWYRAFLRYGDVEISGVTLPGLPPIVVGSNGHLAWGFTVLMADIRDLVRLEINPENPEEYRTPEEWRRFDVVPEKIQVRWGRDVVKEIKQTLWGPVMEKEILGHPVALHWTALQPEAVNLGLLNMDEAKTLKEGVQIMNRFQGPPLNVVIADDQGHIAWTISGAIPTRQGFDGTSSVSWADGRINWRGYIPADQLPHVMDPPSGFLATANNRTLGKGYPYPIGYNFDEGYRAHRISERLQAARQASEREMFDLQLDNTTHFYDFYRELALKVLTDEAIRQNPLLLEAKREIEMWNGRADLESHGFGLLVRFRKVLSKDLFTPILSVCREEDKFFSYDWYNLETPLRMMLTSKIPEINPDPEHYPNWEGWIVTKLEEAAKQLKKEYSKTLSELTWGVINRAHITHPFLGEIPFVGRFFNMPEDPLSGCSICIRVLNPSFGATERMVVSPGHEEKGILHMPGGQSGHPLSSNYSDQQGAWVRGVPLPFLPGSPIHALVIKPVSQRDTLVTR